MSTQPQQFPQSPVTVLPAPAYKLFDAPSVALATFFGTPVAGATLMFVNDRRMNRTTGSSLILLGCLLLTAVEMLISWKIPPAGSTVIGLILIFAMRWVATTFQGKALSEHLARGGQLASKWSAAGVGAIYFVVILAIVFAIVFTQTKATQGTRVAIGKNDEVYYRDGATQADAIALGNDLKSDGYFTDKGATVAIDKTAAGPIVSFVVKEGGWDQPEMVATFDEIGREVAPRVGGFPLHIHLMNKEFEVKSDTIVGKTTLGNDHIYYFGSATDAQAQALGNSLKSQGFFADKGADVFLSKQSGTTSLAFIVGDGVWNDPATVSSFEKIARDAAPSIGGLPIHLRLENTSLEIKKDEPLN